MVTDFSMDSDFRTDRTKSSEPSGANHQNQLKIALAGIVLALLDCNLQRTLDLARESTEVRFPIGERTEFSLFIAAPSRAEVVSECSRWLYASD